MSLSRAFLATTWRCVLQRSLRPHSEAMDWATRKRSRGGNTAQYLYQSERVISPVHGLRETVERVQGRWLLRPQQCGRGARENWRTRARIAKAVSLAGQLKRLRRPPRMLPECDACIRSQAGQVSDVDDCTGYRRRGVLAPGKPRTAVSVCRISCNLSRHAKHLPLVITWEPPTPMCRWHGAAIGRWGRPRK